MSDPIGKGLRQIQIGDRCRTRDGRIARVTNYDGSSGPWWFVGRIEGEFKYSTWSFWGELAIEQKRTPGELPPPHPPQPQDLVARLDHSERWSHEHMHEHHGIYGERIAARQQGRCDEGRGS